MIDRVVDHSDDHGLADGVGPTFVVWILMKIERVRGDCILVKNMKTVESILNDFAGRSLKLLIRG